MKNGERRIRTFEGFANRFTVCPLWPLGYLPQKRERNPTMQIKKESSKRDRQDICDVAVYGADATIDILFDAKD